MTHLKFENVKTESLNIGDTILVDKKMQTIGKNNIKVCSFMGTLLNGMRTEEVTRVLFHKWFMGEVIRYQARI